MLTATIKVELSMNKAGHWEGNMKRRVLLACFCSLAAFGCGEVDRVEGSNASENEVAAIQSEIASQHPVEGRWSGRYTVDAWMHMPARSGSVEITFEPDGNVFYQEFDEQFRLTGEMSGAWRDLPPGRVILSLAGQDYSLTVDGESIFFSRPLGHVTTLERQDPT